MPKLSSVLKWSGLALGGMFVANRVIDAMTPELNSSLPGENHYYNWHGDDVFYKLAGPEDGRPMLLLHGINAAASSYEMRKLLPAFASDYRVYAPDLPGFGLSDRPAIEYNAETYIQLISDFTRNVIGSGQRTVVIASSLTAAHAVEAAAREPELCAALVLISPTGIESLQNPPKLVNNIFYSLLRLPVIGQSLFNLIASRFYLRSFLKSDAYSDPQQVTNAMVDDYHLASHQRGATYAPASFLGGRFNIDISSSFSRLRQPVLVTWGREARITPVWQAEAFAAANSHARIHLFAHSNLLPHDEQAAEFVRVVREWLDEA